ncbi:MAG: hypothetical protein ABIJ08_04095 [Nanoarchaeota archaeon]
MVEIISFKDIQGIENLNKKRFPEKEGFNDFLIMEIQKHLVEINDLKEDNDPHYLAEMIDLSILCRLLASNEGATDKLFKERLKKFKEKARA